MGCKISPSSKLLACYVPHRLGINFRVKHGNLGACRIGLEGLHPILLRFPLMHHLHTPFPVTFQLEQTVVSPWCGNSSLWLHYDPILSLIFLTVSIPLFLPSLSLPPTSLPSSPFPPSLPLCFCVLAGAYFMWFTYRALCVYLSPCCTVLYCT